MTDRSGKGWKGTEPKLIIPDEIVFDPQKLERFRRLTMELFGESGENRSTLRLSPIEKEAIYEEVDLGIDWRDQP